MTATALEFITVLEAVRTRDTRLLSEDLLDLAVADRSSAIQLPNCPGGLGFNLLSADVLRDPVAAQSPMAEGSFGWHGAYGHFWFVDVLNQLSVVSLSNSAMVGCLGQYPRAITQKIYGALELVEC